MKEQTVCAAPSGYLGLLTCVPTGVGATLRRLHLNLRENMITDESVPHLLTLDTKQDIITLALGRDENKFRTEGLEALEALKTIP